MIKVKIIRQSCNVWRTLLALVENMFPLEVLKKRLKDQFQQELQEG